MDNSTKAAIGLYGGSYFIDSFISTKVFCKKAGPLFCNSSNLGIISFKASIAEASLAYLALKAAISCSLAFLILSSLMARFSKSISSCLISA